MMNQFILSSICTLQKISDFIVRYSSICTYVCTVHTLERLANNNNNNNRVFFRGYQ
jgi:hypothetical protein